MRVTVKELKSILSMVQRRLNVAENNLRVAQEKVYAERENLARVQVELRSLRARKRRKTEPQNGLAGGARTELTRFQRHALERLERAEGMGIRLYWASFRKNTWANLERRGLVRRIVNDVTPDEAALTETGRAAVTEK